MKRKRNTLLTGVGVAVVAAVIAVAALSSASGSTTSAATVKHGHALGQTVLVNRAGRTLYSLSAETNGRFICTGSCVSTWRPLTVRRGQRPTGAASLSTIRRLTGQTQVTYRGKPLYTFAGDRKPGDAKGEGFKDVGVWHAAALRSSAKKAPAAPQPLSPGYGTGSDGSGGY
jgi:predicted lipoprotein with Yx(FWY)xxD motif